MLTTAFTDLVGCQVPIQQAGMGGVATPELAAAVADAGGLGMVSMVLQPADAVAAGLDALAKQTRGEVGINFLMPLLDPEAVDAAASRVRVVEAVAAVLLDFPQGEQLIALLAEQEPAVIHVPAGVTGFAHHR